jgi:hypothetical protein
MPPAGGGHAVGTAGGPQHDNDSRVLVAQAADSPASCSDASLPEFDPYVTVEDGPSYSLAFYKTTPVGTKYVVGALMLVSHLMYAYGQVFPMWRLFYIAKVDMALEAKSLEAQAIFRAAGLANPYVLHVDQEATLDTFTYGFAVRQLWVASGLGDKFAPRFAAGVLVLFSGVWPHLKLLLLNVFWLRSVPEIARTTAFYWLSTFGKWSLADVFVVCVMIGVINLDLALDPAQIQRGIVQELPWALGLLREGFPRPKAQAEVCDKLLNLSHRAAAHALCDEAVGMAWDHPHLVQDVLKGAIEGVHATGGGSAQLRIAGLNGIYVFCFGVILSLVLSFAIDVLDHRARAKNAKHRRGVPDPFSLGVTGSPGLTFYTLAQAVPLSPPPAAGAGSAEADAGAEAGATAAAAAAHTGGGAPAGASAAAHAGAGAGAAGAHAAHAAALQAAAAQAGPNSPAYRRRLRSVRSVKDSPGAVLLIRRVSRKVWTLRHYAALVAGSWLAFVLVLLGILTPSMERIVPGSVPEVVRRVIGFEWRREYSLWTLTEVTGASGGSDFLLMGTFAFFTVLGPVLRAAITIIDLLVPMSKSMHKRFMTVINLLGGFCAWEVFFVALFLVNMEMPSITNTILDENTPACVLVSKSDPSLSKSCFMVEFNLLPSFGYVVAGGTVLMLVASLAVKLGFKGLDPYNDGDRGGPYCCDCIGAILFDFDVDQRFRLERDDERGADALLGDASASTP